MKSLPDKQLVLGATVPCPSYYDPSLLQALPRSAQREKIAAAVSPLPFWGYDLWNAYEISWLNKLGVPQNALGVFVIEANTTYLLESKSLKLYLNSLNQAVFEDIKEVSNVIAKDMRQALGVTQGVCCTLIPLQRLDEIKATRFSGSRLDNLVIQAVHYTVAPQLLKTEGEEVVTEQVYSDSFRSLCLVTGQPDWASIQIEYTGPRINPGSLLQYLISYREHAEFHEQCLERIFMDLMRYCQPEKLLVEGRFTRRGGLDINPVRASFPCAVRGSNRLIRQ